MCIVWALPSMYSVGRERRSGIRSSNCVGQVVRKNLLQQMQNNSTVLIRVKPVHNLSWVNLISCYECMLTHMDSRTHAPRRPFFLFPPPPPRQDTRARNFDMSTAPATACLPRNRNPARRMKALSAVRPTARSEGLPACLLVMSWPDSAVS